MRSLGPDPWLEPCGSLPCSLEEEWCWRLSWKVCREARAAGPSSSLLGCCALAQCSLVKPGGECPSLPPPGPAPPGRTLGSCGVVQRDSDFPKFPDSLGCQKTRPVTHTPPTSHPHPCPRCCIINRLSWDTYSGKGVPLLGTANINRNEWSPHRPPKILWVRKGQLGQACLRTASSSGHSGPPHTGSSFRLSAPFPVQASPGDCGSKLAGALESTGPEVALRQLSLSRPPSSPFLCRKLAMHRTAFLRLLLPEAGNLLKTVAALSPCLTHSGLGVVPPRWPIPRGESACEASPCPLSGDGTW